MKLDSKLKHREYWAGSTFQRLSSMLINVLGTAALLLNECTSEIVPRVRMEAK